MEHGLLLGQFYPSDSVLHRLNAGTKLFAELVWIISLFVIRTVWGCLFCFAVLFVCVVLSRVPLRFVFRGFIRFMLTAAVLCVIVLFTSNSGRVLLSFGKIKLASGGLVSALLVFTRLCGLVTGSALLTLTTPAREISESFERGLGFLKHLGVPVHETAEVFTLTLRFVPVLAAEVDRAVQAWKLRGAYLGEGNPVQRARAAVPLMVPVFVSAFRRAGRMADAMESRAYGSHTSVKDDDKPVVADRDFLTYAAAFLYFGLVIAGRLEFAAP